MGYKFAKNKHLQKQAYAIYYPALKNGTLKKWETCEICGSDVKVVGHHTDYAYPLDVQWLCRKCHGKAHTGELTVGNTWEALKPLMTIEGCELIIERAEANLKHADEWAKERGLI